MSKGALTRTRILDEALRLASRDGLEGLTIGSLAEALSLSKSGLFAHFGSKDTLQVAVLEHTWLRFQERARRKIQEQAPGLAQLEALFQAWLDWIEDPGLPGGCPVLGACFELEDREGAPREVLVSLQRTQRDRVRGMVNDAVSSGELALDTPVDQFIFELRGITFSFHHASRVMRDSGARDFAWGAFQALVQRFRR